MAGVGRGSTNKPVLQAALLGVKSSPQYQLRELRQRSAVLLG